MGYDYKKGEGLTIVYVPMFFIFSLIVLTLCGGCAASSTEPECVEGSYVEFKPVVQSEKDRKIIYVVDESKADERFYGNLKFVLDYYISKYGGDDYKVVDNKVMVTCADWKNKEAMANVTQNALDENWLRRSRFYVRGKKIETGMALSIYNSITKELQKTITLPFKGEGGLYSQDGRWIIYLMNPDTGGMREVIVINPDTGECLGAATVDKDVGYHFDVSPDGKQLIVYDWPPSPKHEGVIKKRVDLEPVSSVQ